jgi:oligopeptide/dipeptide ABC transporter ATP-binding protein
VTLDQVSRGAPLLDVRDLHAEFRTSRGVVHAVNGVNFTVNRGELVGIVGESGCGKSATIRSMIGLLRPPGVVSGGQVLFKGKDLLASKRERRKLLAAQIGFVPQNPFGALNPVMRIDRQFVRVIREHTDLNKKQAVELAATRLERAGIADPQRVLRGYAHQLSGGMAQRTVIAIAMSLDPDLVIGDEPTTGLDVTVQRQILDDTVEQLERDQRAMLLVTHDLGIVAHYCTRVIVMYAGKVIEQGPTELVFTNPAHPYTELLLAAAPRRDQPLKLSQGQLPDLINYPTNCPFYERCEYRDDPRCESEVPEMREVQPGHFAATFHHAARASVRSSE